MYINLWVEKSVGDSDHPQHRFIWQRPWSLKVLRSILAASNSAFFWIEISSSPEYHS